MRAGFHRPLAYGWLFLLLLMSAVHARCGYSHAGIGGGGLSGHAWGTDDAYISYRYARNLVEGHGLVFNPGERVEGYSNFLYVLLMALAFLVNVQHAYLFSVLVNLMCIALAFWVFQRYAERQLGANRALAAGLLFALCPPIWTWVAAGMETPLVILLTLGIWVTVEDVAAGGGQRHLILLCGVMVLSMLARADGFVPAAIAIAYLCLQRRWPAVAWCSLTVLVTMAVYSLWRHEYYGYLLPNTYYVKVSGPLAGRVRSAGAQLVQLAIDQGLLPFLLVFAGSLVNTMWSHIRPNLHIRRAHFPAFFAACWILYWLYVGGDVFGERFLVVLFPLGIYELLSSMTLLKRPRALVLAVGVVMAVQVRSVTTDQRFAYSLAKYDRWIELGKFLGEHYRGRTLAIDAAGKVPFFSGLKTIDMLGLNDTFIAHKPVTFYFWVGHNKFDAHYVLSQRPDLIAAWNSAGRDLSWGLTRTLYEPAGYQVRYLVNANKQDARDNIVDVAGADDERIAGLMDEGFRYVVLERAAPPSP